MAIRQRKNETPAQFAARLAVYTAQKATERQAKVDAAAGGWVQLPALVDRRTQTIAPATLLDVAKLLVHCIERDELTTDTESSGYPLGHNRYQTKTIQLGNHQLAAVLDPGDPEQARLIRNAVAKARVLYAYAATADVCPLVYLGLADESLWDKVRDVAIEVRLAGMGVRMQAGLKDTAAELLDDPVAPDADKARGTLFKVAGWLTETKVDTEPERNGWLQVDPHAATMVRYAASDVLDTAAIGRRVPAINPQVLDRERWLQRVTARLSQHGLKLRAKHTHDMHTEHTAAFEDYSEQLHRYVDNPNSTQQVGTWLGNLGLDLPLTESGKPSSAKEEIIASLGSLPEVHPGREAAELVLAYRKVEKRLSTYLIPYVDALENGDGRVRPTIYTLGADTGRMSSARPNLQNVPRQGGLRACIGADPGFTLVSADLAGIEMRVMAAMSQDQMLLKMIEDSTRAEGMAKAATTDAQRLAAAELKKNSDLHWRIAMEVFGQEATKEDRYNVKPVVYAHFYGGGIPTIARQVGQPAHVVAMVIDALADLCAGLRQWSDDTIREIRNGLTEFQLYNGRTLYLDPDVPYKGPNWIIQGTAREIIVDGMERWEQTRWSGGLVLPVHDELVCQVPEEDGPEAAEELRQALCGEFMGVEIAAECGEPSTFWQDAS